MEKDTAFADEDFKKFSDYADQDFGRFIESECYEKSDKKLLMIIREVYLKAWLAGKFHNFLSN